MKRPSLANTHKQTIMRHIFLIAFAIVLSLCEASAQDYKPTTTWPYAYPEFLNGDLKQIVGPEKKGKYNIHLAQGTLHFIEGEMIREAVPTEVFSVKIGNDIYSNANGTMMKVLAKSEKGYVALEEKADFAALNNTGGAYGSSSNSLSTQALSSLEGIGGTRTNMNHMELKNSKDEGSILPVTSKLYLVIPGYVVFAGKKDVSELAGLDKKELNEFIKENKIKWKDPQSLLLLVDYMADKL